MSKRKPGISRRDFVGVSIGAVVVAGVGCGSSDNKQTGAGGQPGVGGNSTGGAGSSTGGAGTGGAGSSAGGAGTGGAGAGGANTGKGGAGGAATGGKSSGAGGSATGGASTAKGGASATGGAPGAGGTVATGGTTGASTGETPLVALVRGTDWVQATQDAIAAVGGLPDLTGKKVLLRPNVIDNTTDDTTSPDVIHGVIKAVKAKGATDITVAEDGWNAGGGGGTLACMKSLKIQDACDAEGAKTMDLGAAANTKTSRNGIDFSDAVYNADYVIAIPKCKRHTTEGNFTMALKLWYGNTKNNRAHLSDGKMPGTLHAIRKADFTVLDATACMTKSGPTGGTMVQSKIVVASKDAIASDVTGLLILKYSGDTVISTWADAWNNNQIKQALAQKIPGYSQAAPSAQSQQAFPYVAQGVTEAATIMGY